ncbi:MAG: tRNA guanosine(34) transglycosylase Tgt [Patescibacteria group bacterium]
MARKIFDIDYTCSTTKARGGMLQLPHGTVKTPVFMPIGTLGSIKSLSMDEMQQLGAQIILGNTYHLWLQPGLEILQKAEGLHSFNTWRKPILTDSGGFQAFSLSKISKFSEEGVRFRVPKNGDTKFLSPEKSMKIQTILGSDIALVLDQALAAEVSESQAKKAMERTYRWAKRSKIAFELLRQQYLHQNLLFGIPQGAQFTHLRKESARLTMELDLPGYSIGGVANGGEPQEIMYSQVLAQTEILEEYKPRHLLGVGTPKDIVEMVARGIDMFDCVYPTRNARHGSLLVKTSNKSYKKINITSSAFLFDFSPINPNSKLNILKTYSKAYLCHLFRAKELLAYRLATLHNLEFYFDLMDQIRKHIENDSFKYWWSEYGIVD